MPWLQDPKLAILKAAPACCAGKLMPRFHKHGELHYYRERCQIPTKPRRLFPKNHKTVIIIYLSDFYNAAPNFCLTGLQHIRQDLE